MSKKKNILRYLGEYTIEPCPIGWQWVWDDYDGAPDGNRRNGYAGTIEECINEINEIENL